MRTVYLGYLEGVDYLIAQGININTQNNKRQTALHIALENRYSGIASLLIKKRYQFIFNRQLWPYTTSYCS
jgi:ankyrin repeat protein